MYILKTTHNFEASHHLKGHLEGCRNNHGHSYQVYIEIAQEDLQTEGAARGMILDFKDVKKIFKEYIDFYDHAMIIEHYDFGDKPTEHRVDVKIGDLDIVEQTRVITVPYRPTAENMCKYFFDDLVKLGVPVYSIEVYETRNNSAKYCPKR